jgi:hypothetical protein
MPLIAGCPLDADPGLPNAGAQALLAGDCFVEHAWRGIRSIVVQALAARQATGSCHVRPAVRGGLSM